MPPPFGSRFEYEKVTPPKNLSDLPRFLKELLGGFFSRMGYIFGLVWKTGPWILFTLMFFAIFQGIMPYFGSRITQEIINRMQNDPRFDGEFAAFLGCSLFVLLVLMFSYNILNSLIAILKNTVTRIAGELVVRTVKLEIMNKAKTLDLASFDMPAFYEKLENANREAGNRPIQILSSTFSIITAIITLVSYIIVLATVMWWAALVMIAVSIPSAIISFSYRRKNFNYMRRKSKDRRQMAYYSDLMVNKDVAKEVRLFDLSETFIGRYRDVFDRYYNGIRKLIWQENAWSIGITIVSAVVNCYFYGYFAYLAVSGKAGIGDYTMYTAALGQVAGQVGTLINIFVSIYEGTLFIDNLTSFLKEEPTVVPTLPPERKDVGPRKVNHGSPHTFQFEHVSFTYTGSDHAVLHDINLTIRPGETLVLVGLNGAGKTTLLKLLTRLYDPTEGRILLDGYDLKEYDVKDLYTMYGIIFQDFGKYAVSVTENIQFGDIHKEALNAETTPDSVKEAAKNSDSDTFISKLPDGYDTPLMRIFDEKGIELSGGQWQKLAIARAFYSDSDVLILDEPTASLDPMAEQEIFNQFDRLRSDKTTIFVSHRLSSATVASKIVVLEYGHLIEEGDHKTLMAKRGRYYELFSTQARRYVMDASETADSQDILERAEKAYRQDAMRQDNSVPMPQFRGPQGGNPPMGNGHIPPFGSRRPNHNQHS